MEGRRISEFGPRSSFSVFDQSFLLHINLFRSEIWLTDNSCSRSHRGEKVERTRLGSDRGSDQDAIQRGLEPPAIELTPHTTSGLPQK